MSEINKDKYLKFYQKFKSEFLKCELFYGIQFDKKLTDKFTKIFKLYKPEYKNISPIKHSSNSPDNIFITKFLALDPKGEEIINQILKENDLADKAKITNEKLNLNLKNFSYDECFKFFIEYLISINEETEENKETLLKSIPNGFEVIGKLAHFNLKDNYLKYKFVIGQLTLEKNPSIQTVVNKVGKIENIFRTYQIELLAGKEEYNVEHREGNCKFRFDLRKTYWSSKLQQERSRIIKLIKPGEVICDAFCGVGPLSIRACKEKNVIVYANDLNPDSYEYLNNNIKINKIKADKIFTYNLDARDFIKSLVEMTKIIVDKSVNEDKIFPIDLHIDHFYMNLPKDAIEFLDVFIGLFKGCKKEIYNENNLPQVHVYGFAKDDESGEESLLKRIAAIFNMEFKEFKTKCGNDILHIEKVREISTRKVVFCIDMKIPVCIAFSNKKINKNNKEIDNENKEDNKLGELEDEDD